MTVGVIEVRGVHHARHSGRRLDQRQLAGVGQQVRFQEQQGVGVPLANVVRDIPVERRQLGFERIREGFVQNIVSDRSLLAGERARKVGHHLPVVRSDAVGVGVKIVESAVDAWIELPGKQIVPISGGQVFPEADVVETKRLQHPVGTGCIVHRLVERNSGRDAPLGESFPAAPSQKARVGILVKIDDGVDPAAPRLVHNAREIVEVALGPGSLNRLIGFPHKQEADHIEAPRRQRVQLAEVRVADEIEAGGVHDTVVEHEAHDAALLGQSEEGRDL